MMRRHSRRELATAPPHRTAIPLKLWAIQVELERGFFMTVTVQVPEQLATQPRQGSDEARSRQFLEAFVLQRFAEGELTTMQVGEALGLTFHEALEFLRDHNAPPDVTAEEHRQDLANLKRMLGQWVEVFCQERRTALLSVKCVSLAQIALRAPAF